MKQVIAERLKKLRESYNLSQREVAEKLYITQAAYSLIEKGRNSLGMEHVVRLSNLYNTTPDYIILGDTITPEE